MINFYDLQLIYVQEYVILLSENGGVFLSKTLNELRQK